MSKIEKTEKQEWGGKMLEGMKLWKMQTQKEIKFIDTRMENKIGTNSC